MRGARSQVRKVEGFVFSFFPIVGVLSSSISRTRLFPFHFFVAFLLVSPAYAAFAQPLVASENAEPKPEALNQLVRDVVHNEIENQLHDNSLWCFREQKQEDGKPERTVEVCQTKDGDIERLIAVNGLPITADQMKAEDQRVQKLISHPEQLRAKQKKQNEDGEQVRTLLRVFPDAFQFQCLSDDGNIVKLNFKPNPSFHPATRAAQVFHHMEGTLIIDRKQKRIAEVQGTLTSEVKFAGGLLGHLDKGGTFLVKSQQVAPGHWDATMMHVQMYGRALFFKTIAVRDKEIYSDYTPAPSGVSLQRVAEFLKKECDNVRTASTK